MLCPQFCIVKHGSQIAKVMNLLDWHVYAVPSDTHTDMQAYMYMCV